MITQTLRADLPERSSGLNCTHATKCGSRGHDCPGDSCSGSQLYILLHLNANLETFGTKTNQKKGQFAIKIFMSNMTGAHQKPLLSEVLILVSFRIFLNGIFIKN